jgi:hypothetical protein
LPPKCHSKKGKDKDYQISNSTKGFFVITHNRQLRVCTGEHLYVASYKKTIMEYFSKHLQPTPQFYQHIPCAGCKQTGPLWIRIVFGKHILKLRATSQNEFPIRYFEVCSVKCIARFFSEKFPNISDFQSTITQWNNE